MMYYFTTRKNGQYQRYSHDFDCKFSAYRWYINKGKHLCKMFDRQLYLVKKRTNQAEKVD